MASLVYKKVHVAVLGRRTTINIYIYLTALFLKKHTREETDPLNLTDTNVSDVRRLIQREIDTKNNSKIMHLYPQYRLKERVEIFLINEIADPKLKRS
jgi:hypothetical protein